MDEAQTAVIDENQASSVPHVHTEACYEYPEPEEVVTYVPIEVPVEPEVGENGETAEAAEVAEVPAESDSSLSSPEAEQNDAPQTQTVMQEVVTYVQPDPILICGYQEGELVPQAVSQTGEAVQGGEAAGQTGEANQQTDSAASEPKLHVHTDACYTDTKVLTCQIPEHTHEEICYSNRNAGVETAGDWEYMFVNLAYTHDWAKDLVTVAKTQLGYHDKTENFIINEDGSKSFYSRYGAWYGIPYGDWCAMFASFCLNYARVPETFVPRGAACGSWVQSFKAMGLYRDLKTEDYVPVEGDLVFFHYLDSPENVVDHVGIVSKVTETGIVTIEGNMSHEVGSFSYAFGDLTIIGYAQMPVNPDYAEKEEMADQSAEQPEGNTESQSAEQSEGLSEGQVAGQSENESEKQIEGQLEATEESTFPAVHLEADAEDGTRVLVDAPEGALPEGVQLYVTSVEAEAVAEAVENTVEGNVVYTTAVDITFKDASGNEIEPAKNIHVNIIPAELPDEITADAAPMLVHIDNEGEATVVEQVEETREDTSSVTFESDEFSVYVVAYTVDFHFYIDGKAFDYSIPGGGSITIRDLAVILNIVDIEMSEIFSENVADAVFSNPDLVYVYHADRDMTIEEIREEAGMGAVYSGELTEEQVAGFNAVQIGAGDWVLLSIAPFTSDESLTVTMKDGDIFTIQVTDMTADNSKWTVNYTVNDPDAGYVNGKRYTGTASNVDSSAGNYSSFTGIAKGRASGTLINNNTVAYPRPGYSFKFWRRDDGTVYTDSTLSSNSTTVTKDNQTFTAYFVPTGEYYVWFEAAPGGTVDKNFGYSGAVGATATPSYGYTFTGWYDKDTGQLVSVNPTMPNGLITKDTTLQARFTEVPPDITINYHVSPANGGNVSRASEKVQYYGTAVGSRAAAHDGYLFLHWEDVNGGVVSEDEMFVPEVSTEHFTNALYTAVFIQKEHDYYLRVSSQNPDMGSVIVTPVSGETERYVYIDESKRLSADIRASKNHGYKFDHWELNGENISVESTIAYETDLTENSALRSGINDLVAVFVVDDTPVSPYFQKYYYMVDPSSEGNAIKLINGQGIEKGSGESVESITNTTENGKSVNNGNSVYYAVPVPAEGWRFVNWTNNGKIYEGRANGTNVTDGNTIQPKGKDKDTPGNANYHESDTFVAHFVQENDYLVTILCDEGGYTTVNSDRNKTSFRLSELYTDIGIIAWPNPGYHVLGWADESGNIVEGTHSGDTRLYSENIPRDRDSVFTARFEKITDINVYYRSSSTYGTVSREHEMVHLAPDIDDTDMEGSTATPRAGYKFISWVNNDGEMIWPLEEFYLLDKNMLREGITFTAVFETAAYERYLMIQPEDVNQGYVIAPQYENSVNGHVVTMYIDDWGKIPEAMTAVPYEDWKFDHWEIQSQVVMDPSTGEPLGATIPKGFNFSDYDLMPKRNVLMAYFVVDDHPLIHRITYKTTPGGTVTGNAGKVDGSGNYYDEWIGSRAEGVVLGATAVADTGYEFKGWAEEILDEHGNPTGDYIFPAYDMHLLPKGELLRDTTYIATYIPVKNLVGYNMNVANVPVRWNGVKDLVVASANVSETTNNFSPMYYDTNNGRYWKQGDVFSLSTEIPEADGYYFIGWYNKNRPKYEVNNIVYHDETQGNIIARGKRVDDEGRDMDHIYFPYKSDKNRYTFEAMYIGIKGESKRLPYDNQFHELIAEAYFEKGNVEGTDRYKQQLERIKNNAGYSMGPVYYQLIDDNGNPVGEPTTEFKRLDPGFYKVRAYADGTWDQKVFRVYTDITLEIYPARLIIKKYWINDEGMGIRPDELDVTESRYDPKTQGVVDVTNKARLDNARAASTDVTAAELFGDRTATPEAPKDEPAWEINGNVWTKVYNDIIVRDSGYGETDQKSGYYLHFAREVVPEEYVLVNETWERSEDMLTTTITFTNEPVITTITLHKLDENGSPLSGAKFALYKVRNFKQEPLGEIDPATGDIVDPQVIYSPSDPLIFGSTTIDLSAGYYELVEVEAPVVHGKAYQVLRDPIYFSVLKGVAALTDKNGNPLTMDTASFSGLTLYVSNYPLGNIEIEKEDKTTKQALPGAVFQLVCDKEVVDPTKEKFSHVTGLGTVNVDGTDQKGAFTTDGSLHEIRNLPDGVYSLIEIRTPENYANEVREIQFTITRGIVTFVGPLNREEDVKMEKANEIPGTTAKFTIGNTPGVSLPSTGGSGTSRFYLVGVLMTFGAAVVWLRRRRKRFG